MRLPHPAECNSAPQTHIPSAADTNTRTSPRASRFAPLLTSARQFSFHPAERPLRRRIVPLAAQSFSRSPPHHPEYQSGENWHASFLPDGTTGPAGQPMPEYKQKSRGCHASSPAAHGIYRSIPGEPRYFFSSSLKHSSSVFTANSACSSSTTRGGQNRTVVSPDPRISSPL